jgi:hypothetical protein
MAIALLSLTGTTASRADIRIRDKVNEMIAVLNALPSQPAPAPQPPSETPAPIIAITKEQSDAILALPVGAFFTLQYVSPEGTYNIVSVVNG